MRTSKLDRRLRLEAAVEHDDGEGGLVVTFIDKGLVWAAIASTPGAEQAIADTRQSLMRLTVTLRRRTDIARGMRLIDRARIYRIVAVEEAGRGFVRAVCVEVANSE